MLSCFKSSRKVIEKHQRKGNDSLLQRLFIVEKMCNFITISSTRKGNISNNNENIVFFRKGAFAK